MKKTITAADILLPGLNVGEDWTKWAVIACDQHTSEPEYWKRASALAGDNPSSLNLVLPEIYLSAADEKIKSIKSYSCLYLKEVFVSYGDCLMYIERKIPDGRIRKGIIAALDLEDYDYSPDAKTAVRATEGTVLSHIPARVRIRENSFIELPHVMLLYNDSAFTADKIIENHRGTLKSAYDFDLMLGGGSIAGYFTGEKCKEELLSYFNEISDRESLAFAVGDGNHSLASAKALWENEKKAKGEGANPLLRYALVELVNIHSPALDFRPIHRLISGKPAEDFLCFAKKIAGKKPFLAKCVSGGKEFNIPLPDAPGIMVNAVQILSDAFIKENPDCEIDYIHGDDTLMRLSGEDNAIGIFCDTIEKESLFNSVKVGGPLPRKSFSMGEAAEKRYYIEARKIR